MLYLFNKYKAVICIKLFILSIATNNYNNTDQTETKQKINTKIREIGPPVK